MNVSKSSGCLLVVACWRLRGSTTTDPTVCFACGELRRVDMIGQVEEGVVHDSWQLMCSVTKLQTVSTSMSDGLPS